MPRRPVDPEARQRWQTFLSNHREVIAAIDFFTVPTATFRVLYVFFVVHHARRELMHFRVTEHPTAAWITQQLREALPYDQAPRYLILDRDAKYGHEVLTAIHHMGVIPKQITARSPWQNGVAERFVSTARRDLLDRVIVLNEKHLQRLLAGFCCRLSGSAAFWLLAREPAIGVGGGVQRRARRIQARIAPRALRMFASGRLS
jgi:transposase InsO family protein